MSPDKDQSLHLGDQVIDLGAVAPSEPRPQAVKGTIGTSTDERKHKDSSIQVISRQDVSTQPGTSHLSALNGREQASQLAPFLARVEPVILQELVVTVHAQHPSGTTIKTAPIQDPSDLAAEQLFTLHGFSCGATSDPRLRTNQHGLQVTALAWTKTGQTLAAAFGRLEASGCSLCPGVLAAWNLARQGGDSHPSTWVDLDEGLTALAFHPHKTGLLAGGGLRGSVYLWDLAQDEGDIQLSRSDCLSDCRHQEPVTALCWQYSPSEARRRGLGPQGGGLRQDGAHCHRLFSLATDGRLLMWSGQQLGAPLYGWELSWAAPGWPRALTVGGTCLAVCPPASGQEDVATCMVGAEGGHLLKCKVGDVSEAAIKEFTASQEPAQPAAGPGPGCRLLLRTAVQDPGYSSHTGQVTSIAVSPFQRQLFLSCGTEGCVRLYALLRHELLLFLEPCSAPLLAVAWSPSRPLVFATASSNGCVYLYDLAAGQELLTPVMALEVASSSSSSSSATRSGAAGMAGGSQAGAANSCAVHALAFNPGMPSVLAAAAGDTAKVWHLPPSLVSAKAGEEKLLQRMVNTEDVVGFLQRQALVR